VRRNVTDQGKHRARELRKNLSPAEIKLWSRLRGGRFGGLHVRRQHPIGPYIVDFFLPKLRLVIEVDGSSHDSRAEEDETRDCYLKKQGLDILRFQNRDVMQRINDVLDYLSNYCANRSQPPS
jgi:very-short-patch-repair endonuclease